MILKEEINSNFFFISQNRYGFRRIAAELQKSGYQLSHSTVLKIYERIKSVRFSKKK